MTHGHRSPPDWDARYAAAAGEGLYGAAPNEYLRMILARSDMDIRSALMLADGDGRNGAWLAGQGLRVTSVDLSRTATRLAADRDAERGVEVERITADLADWTPEEGRRWDAVFLFYLHCPAVVRDRALRLAVAALSPGGWAVIEGFAKGQAVRPGMGPDSPENLYDVAELEAVLGGLVTVEAFTGRTLLAEGSAHRGEAEIVRLAARKPSVSQPAA